MTLAAVDIVCLCASGVFTLRVAKEMPGQHFEGLQMLTSLLAPKGSRSAKPLVEDVGMSEWTDKHLHTVIHK